MSEIIITIIFVLLLVFLVGLLIYAVSTGNKTKTITIDGCEYVKTIFGSELTHKGNCPNHGKEINK